MAKKGENIYLRKDGRYEGRYIKARKPDGRAVFGSVYGQRYEEVKRELTLLKAQQYQQGDIVSRAYQSATMREWSEYWLEVLTRPFVKQTTYELYRSKVQKWILPRLGECPLESITQSRLQVFVCELRSELSPNTARDVYRLLKALLRAAKDRGLIRNEPWSGVRSRGGQLNAQPRVLDLQEQQRFEQLCRARNMPEFLLALYTGLRIGELELQGVHCHTLRHTYATRCLEQKIGIEVLAELLGAFFSPYHLSGLCPLYPSAQAGRGSETALPRRLKKEYAVMKRHAEWRKLIHIASCQNFC